MTVVSIFVGTDWKKNAKEGSSRALLYLGAFGSL